jgi:hypothetical protein
MSDLLWYSGYFHVKSCLLTCVNFSRSASWKRKQLKQLKMEKALRLLAIAGAAQFLGFVHGSTIELSSTPPENASNPIPEAFVSYSIEFASFPDFAGISPFTKIHLRFCS